MNKIQVRIWHQQNASPTVIKKCRSLKQLQALPFNISKYKLCDKNFDNTYRARAFLTAVKKLFLVNTVDRTGVMIKNHIFVFKVPNPEISICIRINVIYFRTTGCALEETTFIKK